MPKNNTNICAQSGAVTGLAVSEGVYHDFIQKTLPEARRFLWIATADIKDMHVRRGRRFVPFLMVLAEIIRRGVEVRLLHAKEPGPRFRRDFDRFDEFVTSDRFDRVLCPRVHFKSVIVDGRSAYIGSANLTGAGLGAKGASRRNFEAGILTRDPVMIRQMMELFDAVFMGEHCPGCGRRDVCADPVC